MAPVYSHPCYHFQTWGKCAFGKRCMFVHTAAHAPTSDASHRPSNPPPRRATPRVTTPAARDGHRPVVVLYVGGIELVDRTGRIFCKSPPFGAVGPRHAQQQWHERERHGWHHEQWQEWQRWPERGWQPLTYEHALTEAMNCFASRTGTALPTNRCCVATEHVASPMT